MWLHPSVSAIRCLNAVTDEVQIVLQVRVLCRSQEQVTAVLSLPWLEEVTIDFLGVQGLKEAVANVRAAGKRVVVALPRILKPQEQDVWRFFLSLSPDALLIRSAGVLHTLTSLGGPGTVLPHGSHGNDLVIPQLHGDFSLNAANALA
jgi:U32 family peptidase